MTTVGSALRHSKFRWYLAGMSAFGLVQTMNRFLLPWLAYEATSSSTVLGLVGLALAAPTLLLSPIGGVYADRVQRLKLIRRTQLMWAVLFALFASAFASGNGGLEMIFIVAVVSGGLLAFEQPARQALIPSLVPHAGLSSAYGWINASWNVSGMLGPSLAAVLLSATLPFGMGAAPLLALTAGGSLVMVLMTTRVNDVLPRPAPSGLRWWQDMAAGLRFIAVSPVPRFLVLLAFAINALGFSAVFLMPAFAQEVFNAGVGRVGLLVSAWGAGALLGLTGMSLGIGDRYRRGVALFVPVLLGLVLLAAAVSRSYEVTLCLIALAGALAFMHLTVAQTILQLHVPELLRGRVMGIYVLSYASAPLGATLLGTLASATGTPAAVGVGASVLCIAATAAMLRLRRPGNVV